MPKKYKHYPGEKLELGAGNRPTPGYIHNDIRPLEDIEIVCDIREIKDYVEPGWGEIRATHVLEHFSPTEGEEIIRDVRELLILGGIFYIEVPNFGWQTRAHANKEITDAQAVYYVFGEQDYPENTHKNGFTDSSLQSILFKCDYLPFIKDIGQVLICQASAVSYDEV